MIEVYLFPFIKFKDASTPIGFVFACKVPTGRKRRRRLDELSLTFQDKQISTEAPDLGIKAERRSVAKKKKKKNEVSAKKEKDTSAPLLSLTEPGIVNHSLWHQRKTLGNKNVSCEIML